MSAKVTRGDVLARLRSGDYAARRELVSMVDGGVRFLLARHLNGSRLKDAVADVHERVLLAIANGAISSLDELPSLVRKTLKTQISTRTPQATKPVDPLAVENLQDALNSNELDVLHRYYVLGHSAAQISQATGLSAEDIQAVKQRARQLHNRPALAQTVCIGETAMMAHAGAA
jgi:hypothetical protein